MKEEKIKEIINAQVATLSNLSAKMSDGFDKDTIHKFRVAFKTLRSFLRMLRMYIKKAGLKLPKKIKRLYHIAGAIRDAQLKLEKTEQHGLAIPGYTQHLRNIILQQKNEWDLHYSKKTLRKLGARFAAFECGPVHPVTMAGFIDSKIISIDSLCRLALLTDNQLHTIRKLMKDVIYTAGIAEKNWKTAFEKIKETDIAAFNLLAAAIGDYNDERALLEHLIPFSSRQNAQDKKIIKTFCTKKSAEQKSRKQNIIAEVQRVIASGIHG